MKKRSIFIMIVLAGFISINLYAGRDKVKRGRILFEQWCAHCHGEGEVASIFLEKRYQGAIPGALAKRTTLTRALILLRVRTQIPGMPAFRPTELSDQEISLLADYLIRNNSK